MHEMIDLPFNDEWITVIKAFISSCVKEAGANGAVIGLSGGLDSSVVTKLCADVLGKNNTHAIIMPDDVNRGENAIKAAKAIGIEPKIVNITELVDCFVDVLPSVDKKNLGNIKARVRMIVLYYHANRFNYVVMGTSNKSELAVGYFTKYGDGAADYLPIGDLYKSQVRVLAKKIGIPDWIIKRTPSAELWAGQYDEAEIGMSYDLLDKILYGFEIGMKTSEIAEALNIPEEEAAKVYGMMTASMHKRRTPHIAKVSLRTFGVDWREW